MTGVAALLAGLGVVAIGFGLLSALLALLQPFTTAIQLDICRLCISFCCSLFPAIATAHRNPCRLLCCSLPADVVMAAAPGLTDTQHGHVMLGVELKIEWCQMLSF